jgi:L-idonate 5-dehydrogenase
MRALVIHKALDLRIEERSIAALGPNDVEVAIRRGGICGSDLHYWKHGGFGVIHLKEPMILGHEVAGEVAAIGSAVTRVKPGDRIAVNPSRPCEKCAYCSRGLQNQCLDMRFYGSAMRMPHVQGAFAERLVAEERQCVPVATGVSLEEAAMAEPFAVTLHGVARAGELLNKRALVTGCGPIGTLAIIALRVHGVRDIIATDISEHTLALARIVGADATVNMATNAADFERYTADKGFFDIQIEASGAEAALRDGLRALKPRGVLIQLGLCGDIAVPQNTIVAKEIEVKGSFRFHEEFDLAVDMIGRRRVDLKPLLTDVLPLDRANDAFALAADRNRAMKVQLAFG